MFGDGELGRQQIVRGHVAGRFDESLLVEQRSIQADVVGPFARGLAEGENVEQDRLGRLCLLRRPASIDTFSSNRSSK